MDENLIAKDTLPLTEKFEGCVLHAYQDAGGVWTIGWGTTRDVNNNPITASTPNMTQEQADFLLQRDLGRAVKAVIVSVKVALSYDQAAALTDFVYNLGVGNFEASTLLRKLNTGDYVGAADQILLWDRVRGQELAGLLRRRHAEQQEFLSPDNSTLDNPTY